HGFGSALGSHRSPAIDHAPDVSAAHRIAPPVCTSRNPAQSGGMPLLLEVDRENLIAYMQLVARNDEYEYSTRLQPAVAVLQKDLLYPRIPAFTALKLIWRVQVQQ